VYSCYIFCLLESKGATGTVPQIWPPPAPPEKMDISQLPLNLRPSAFECSAKSEEEAAMNRDKSNKREHNDEQRDPEGSRRHTEGRKRDEEGKEKEIGGTQSEEEKRTGPHRSESRSELKTFDDAEKNKGKETGTQSKGDTRCEDNQLVAGPSDVSTVSNTERDNIGDGETETAQRLLGAGILNDTAEMQVDVYERPMVFEVSAAATRSDGTESRPGQKRARISSGGATQKNVVQPYSKQPVIFYGELSL